LADRQKREHARLRELSEADRAYRAAFQEMTSAGGFTPSSFASLLAAVVRLHRVVQRLEEHERPSET
jgi:hypothetical protein